MAKPSGTHSRSPSQCQASSWHPASRPSPGCNSTARYDAGEISFRQDTLVLVQQTYKLNLGTTGSERFESVNLGAGCRPRGATHRVASVQKLLVHMVGNVACGCRVSWWRYTKARVGQYLEHKQTKRPRLTITYQSLPSPTHACQHPHSSWLLQLLLLQLLLQLRHQRPHQHLHLL